MTSWNTFSKSQLASFIIFSLSDHLSHLHRKYKNIVYVLLSRWLSISGFLYPYTTLHSLLMANYIKYNGLIMLNSESETLKYGIIHFMFPIIPYCRIITHFSKKKLTTIHTVSDIHTKAQASWIWLWRTAWIKHYKAILHLSILRLHSWEKTKQRVCEQSALRSLCWWAVSPSDGARGVGLTPDVPE